jgi:hypothetical protein
MTTAIPTQTVAQTAADDLAIVRTPATYADAQLVLQQQIADAISGATEGYDLLMQFDEPPTLGQLRKRHPRDSAEHRKVMAFLMSCETTSTFVRQGILNEALVDDLYAVAAAYKRMEKLIKGLRRETGEPRMLENAEWLAKRAT